MNPIKRLALMLFVVASLSGCAGPSPTPLAAPFEAHLSEYLNPQWTNRPEHEDGLGCNAVTLLSAPNACGLEGSIRDHVIIVDVNPGGKPQIWHGFLFALAWPENLDKAKRFQEKTGVPIVSLARTPEEVGTLVLVWRNMTDFGTYESGATGYRTDLMVKVVDFEKQEIVGEAYIQGWSGPQVKQTVGDWVGPEPWEELLIVLSCAASPRLAAEVKNPTKIGEQMAGKLIHGFEFQPTC